MRLIRASLISVKRKKAFTGNVIFSGILFCMASLLATQSHAVDYEVLRIPEGHMENEVPVINMSAKHIKVCSFNGNDKTLLIPFRTSVLYPSIHGYYGCIPDATGTCKIRLVREDLKCNDSSWPVINARIGHTVELREWNGVSDSSMEIWIDKTKFTSFNGKVSSTNTESQQPAAETKPKVLRQVWIGTAPACAAQKSDCTARGWTYVKSDKKGDGKKCLNGTKVLCEYYE